jgi:Aminotransferase class-III
LLSPGYFTKVRELCTAHDVMLILDGIQTGLGRTGKLLAEQHDGIEADVTLLDKALSGGFYLVSAVLSNNAVLGTLKPGQLPFSCIHSQPRSIARLRPAPYSAGLRCSLRNGQLIFSMWRRPSCTGSTELAISINLRAAASASEKRRLATNFMEAGGSKKGSTFTVISTVCIRAVGSSVKLAATSK